MTTVVFKDGVMACDSCYSYAGSVDTLSRKIYRLKSGGLLGQAGANDAREVMKLVEKVRNAREMPLHSKFMEIRLDFLGLLVLPSGRKFKIATTFISPDNWDASLEKEDFGAWEIEVPFAAIGSGCDVATGAMAAGANARGAVAIACRFDINSRPPIHSMRLKEWK
jgi:hypothetical protein